MAGEVSLASSDKLRPRLDRVVVQREEDVVGEDWLRFRQEWLLVEVLREDVGRRDGRSRR